MKTRKCGLLVAVVSMVIAVPLMGTSCALDTKGLFNEVGGGDAGIDVCIEFCESGTPDTPADAGSGGNAGEPVDASIYDSCDCGVGGKGGEAGQGGTAGAGGQAGQGGIGGQGGSAGQGGEAGVGGSAGQGGEAGAGGSAGQGGEAGAGGQGGSGPITCQAGESDTPISVTITGAASGSAFVWYWGGNIFHSTQSPTTYDMTGHNFPGQIVGSGFNGLSIVLTYGDAGAQPGEEFYQVNVSNTAECNSTNFYNQTCDEKVARDFRCLYFPAEELDCATVTAQFASLGKKLYHNPPPQPGNSKILVSVRCEP